MKHPSRFLLKGAALATYTPSVLFLFTWLFCGPGLWGTENLRAGEAPRVLFMVGEQEYATERTLPSYAAKELQPRGVDCHFVHVSPDNPNHFEGLEVLEKTDVLVVSVRRRTPRKQQMNLIRNFIERGGAVVGIRTASHAFDREPPDADYARWETFDREILGGHYLGHYGNKPPEDPATEIRLTLAQEAHPVLEGIQRSSFLSTSHLYKNRDMAAAAKVLMEGQVLGSEAIEPVAWTHITSAGGRVFYTSLGNQRDFELQGFRKLLLNAIYWAAGKDVPEGLLEEGSTQDYDPSASYEGWTPLEVPSAWESHASGRYAEHDGFAWYRAYVHIPESWRGSRMLLVADAVDNVDEAFFNGVKVGANGAMPPLYGDPSSSIRRPFVIDPEWVRYGEANLIAWRVYDKGGQGGILRGPVYLSRRDDAIDLQGAWFFRTGDAPAWGRWEHVPGSDAARDEAKHFRALAGPGYAGYRGIVPADIGGRQRRIQEVYDRYKGNTNVHALTEGKGNPLPVDQAREILELGEGLAIDTVLSEPAVRQPLYLDFDARGRLWVVQYIQYPNPAGLEVLTWDNHLRKVFDAVPPPPPFTRPEDQKFIGQDKITIHEDVDGDGVFESQKTFLEGLNMCTSLAFDKDGVWVMNPPYLLFFPDRDHDDQPDGPPEVHLSGFGLEDTHSIANSLKWGPDGWLYGATGSTVTARVKVEQSLSKEPHAFFGQNIWRYHPTQHRFELFAEGGWNTFGVDFDSKGRLYSGTNGNLQAVYFVQGGYYQKSFGKHGPHTNPYTYGHFFGLPIQGDTVRLVHQWIPYESEAIPTLQNLLVGGNSLANKVHALSIIPDGSTFRTIEQEAPVHTKDKWFRPVHAAVGPDGAIYLSDWYDARITHVDPRDNWDRERGRVYRLRSKQVAPGYQRDLSSLSGASLVALLEDPNQWTRSTARRLLRERGDTTLIPLLQERLVNAEPRTALESLWVLGQMGRLDETRLLQGLDHPDPHLREWAIRLAGDRQRLLSSKLFTAMLGLAQHEMHAEVISQLASTAQRLPHQQGYPLVQKLYERHEWTDDTYIPQQVWWALESQLRRHPEGVLDLLKSPSDWQHGMLRAVLLERVSRRLTAEQERRSLDLCALLLRKAPDRDAVSSLLRGMDLALQGARLQEVPVSLEEAMRDVTSRFKSNPDWIGFGLRIGSVAALQSARQMIMEASLEVTLRSGMIMRLAELHDDDSVPILINLLKSTESGDALRLAAMNGLRRFEQPEIADALLELIPAEEGDLRRTAQSVLAGRSEWARRMLLLIQGGTLKREDVPYDVLIALQQREDPSLTGLMLSIWGNLHQPNGAKMQRIKEVRGILEEFQGDSSSGKDVFDQICGICHVFHGHGRGIGPELTGYERSNLEFLLPAIVDPSLAVREEFELVTVTLRSGRPESEGAVLTGFITAMEGDTITIKDLAGNLTVVAGKDVAGREHSPVSIMPGGLLDALTGQQIADLFAYIQH
ncbi:MAG: ThuA domain-containing protein [Verrucomicrobiota bacterium]|nr:ThuA domain-containing protein [Verrucomicrobiota bacterium]